MIRKVGYTVAICLEVMALAGAYIVNYFTNKKMGMARYMVYKNQGWERTYPMDILKYLVIAILTVLTIFAWSVFWKNRKKAGKLLTAMNITMIVLTILYVCYTLFVSREMMRAYYFISLLFGIAAFIQILKTGIANLLCGEKGR